MQSKIPGHKNQESHNSHGKRQSKDAKIKKTKLLELPDKDFKATIINMAQ